MHKYAPAIEGGMAVLKNVNEETIHRICSKHSDASGIVSISGFNSKDQTSISGNKNKIIKVLEEIEKEGGKGRMLQVEAPFHSFYMEEAAEEFRNAMSGLTVCDERQIVISCAT